MRYRGGGSSGIIAEGETVTEGQTILSMPDTATMIAEISVHETEIDKVQVGQAATIVMDAFPDRVLEGEVTEVGSLPDQQRGFLNPDLKVYKTLVTIDGSHDFLKSRMSCKVTILVDNLEDVIIVPIQVVSNRRGKKVCYVLTDSGPEEREVRTGLFNDMFVQVIEGLDAGDEVMLNPPLFSETTGPATFQQQQLPRRRGREGAADANDPGGPGRGGAGRGARRGRRPGGGRTEEQSGRPPQEGGRATEEQVGEQSEPGRLQLTDEMIDRIMAGMKQFDPEKAKDLEELRKSDPEKFKSELQKSMQSMRNRMRQGGGGMGQGGSRVRQGQGNAGSGQNR
jgi:hypothetical protein